MPLLEFLGAALLMAFGILVLYMLFNAKISNKQAIVVLIIGLLAFFGGGYLIVTIVGLLVLLKKLIGLILLGIGIFLIVGFPAAGEEQLKPFSHFGIFIGLILFFLGLFFLIF